MTRKKVKLAYIANDTARKATFKKRKKGLLKKVSELSTLCGVEACAIIFSPYTSHPEIWPSALGVQRVLTLFKNLPEMEQSKKMENQETFLRHRIVKASEQLKKQRRDNREKEIAGVMFQTLVGRWPQSFNMVDLNDLGWLIDQKMMDICRRIEALKQAAHNQEPYVPAALQEDGFKQMAEAEQMVKKPASESSVDTVPPVEPWFMDLMSPPPHDIGFITDDGVNLPFGDEEYHNGIWSDGLFP